MLRMLLPWPGTSGLAPTSNQGWWCRYVLGFNAEYWSVFLRSLVLDYYFEEETIGPWWPAATTLTSPVIVAVVGIQIDSTDPLLSLTMTMFVVCSQRVVLSHDNELYLTVSIRYFQVPICSAIVHCLHYYCHGQILCPMCSFYTTRHEAAWKHEGFHKAEEMRVEVVEVSSG